MTDEFPADMVHLRIATRDQRKVSYAAQRNNVTVRTYLETLTATHAETLEMPPYQWEPTHTNRKDTNT